MYVMPSRGRPHLIRRFFSVAPPQPETIGVIAIDEDDAENYAGVKLPPNWSFRITPRAYFTAKVNEAISAYPNQPFYGFVMDDTVPRTDRWDVLLEQKAGPWGISWSDDCLPGKRPSSIMMGGELVRALGWFSCPTLKHFYTDNVWETMAKDLGSAGRCEEIKIAHLHFSSGAAPYDKTYQERPDNATDKQAFERWLLTWPALKEKLQKEMA
jgi:hypothetical protein